MNNLARHDQNYSMYQEIGTVVFVDIEKFLVKVGESHQYQAKKAAGCLLYPEPGDRVLLVTSTSGECYILSVLERTQEKKNRLLFDGDVELLSLNGKLQFGSSHGINLTSPKEVRLASSSLQVIAEQGECNISSLSFIGNFFESKIDQIKLVAKKYETLFGLIRQKVKRSYRTVEDTDQLKAGKIDYNAERLMSLRGKYSVVTAKEDIKIDGKMIHMG